ncbi:MAG: hypothetical protein QW711_07495, partial [Candidatus Korarchaeum sp.]
MDKEDLDEKMAEEEELEERIRELSKIAGKLSKEVEGLNNRYQMLIKWVEELQRRRLSLEQDITDKRSVMEQIDSQIKELE